MRQVHSPTVPEVEQRSPTGKFHSFCRNLSVALGGARNAGTWGGGHPFDLQIRRLPPGAAVCPFHQHFAQSEMFIVLRGEGTVRTADGRFRVTTGEVFFHPPGTPHQLINTGTVELEVLIIADNPPLDACYYPDSDKWFLRPPGKVFRLTEVDYFDGEDTLPVSGDSSFRAAPAPAPAPAAPFPQRKLHPDALPWSPWESPRKRFRQWSREISIALGAQRNQPPGLGGHPFDLEQQKLPPGGAAAPFHAHAAQWELFFIISGTATVRADAETATLHAGDVVIHPPGEAHQIRNASATDDLLFWLVADNPSVDYWHYPDSQKWGLRAPRQFFRPQAADYFDGEE